ncbi:CotH kinase family protein [Pelagibacterales bacterium SAG-MED01]|nr:CotH kinase family protein [Pelagibacterales bacterium SAG-MED01]
MKKTLKFLIIGSLPFLFVLYLTFLYSIIKSDWNYAHKSMYTYQDPFNWLEYKTKVGVVKSIINFRENSNLGLKTKRIYVEEQNQKKLLSDTPNSTKVWQDGFHYNQENKLKDMQVRFRGDNPRNWLLEKKHWRIKTRKNDVINQKRYFDYLPYNFNKYFSGLIANKIGVLSPEFNLVELYINDTSHGVYIESENLNESFLRRKKIMPVNLYKAENILDESIIALEMNAFNSPGATSKSAIFNQLDKEDKSDLTFFLELIRVSHNDRKYFDNLANIVGINHWAKFTAYQILTQNFHNDNSHNFRIVSDPWSGNLIPIAQDPLIGNLQQKNFRINYSSNDLILLLNQSSLFHHQKLENIYRILNSKEIENLIEEFQRFEKKIKISQKRDVEELVKNFNIFQLIQNLYNQNISNEKTTSENENFLKSYNEYLNRLHLYIKRKPVGGWKENKNGLTLFVDGDLPLSNLRFHFKDQKPDWVALDLNENGVLDKNEKKFYFSKEEDYLLIDYNFYSNRLNFIETTNYQSHINLKTSKTRFKFIFDVPKNPYKIEFENPFTKKIYSLEKTSFIASPYAKLNYPLNINFKNEKTIKLQGNYNFNKTKIYNEKVVIEPGTKFNLKKNVSLIFKNQVNAKGTTDAPIIFQKAEQENWGTVALVGNSTQNSFFENIIFDGGSGFVRENFTNKNFDYFSIGNIRFISSLSLHNAKNILFKNILVKNNLSYDDAIHVIYSQNISFKNLKVNKAFGDGIDIDMSENIYLQNAIIKNSKNDAVDLMESIVFINNSELVGSNDKGISVGENSFLVVKNSKISENQVGIATKDNSYSYIDNLEFKNNDFHIKNYKKNWRYGDGGISEIHNSIFEVNNSNDISKKFNQISADEDSSIKIIKSKIGNSLIDKNIFSITKKNKHINKISKVKDLENQGKLIKKND